MTQSKSTDQTRSTLFQALRMLIRPLARFCVKHNVRLQEFEEVAKLSFLDVAEEELELKGESISQSRLSVITGLHRRDVNRLYVQQSDPKLSHNLLTRVIGQWSNDARFRSMRSGPRRLSLEGRPSEFTDLVWSISRDANPYAVLFELERTGLVRKMGTSVELLASGFLPRGDFDQGFSLLARDSSDLIAAVEENVVDGVKPYNLHLSTEFDNIPASRSEEIRNWFLEEGGKIHEKIRKFLSKLDRDVAGDKLKEEESGRIRAVLGTFSRVHKVEYSESEHGDRGLKAKS